MSNIYIQEPPTLGKVLLTTSVGDIDIELWSKETPKACRNFIQLVMEGYYDGTIFHRVVKEFIVQGGDPLGTGEGGESIYGAPFKDEIHSRLRFNRRGLVAMANAGPNDNGSQFFFTLGPAGELNKKHTIFGKVTGQTLYNMLKLEDGDVDESERPAYPHKVIKGEILSNPFEDIIPRQIKPSRKDSSEEKKTKSKSKATKNFHLLSFGEEAEEDEEETDKVSQSMRGKSKSSHDLIDDPRLSSTPAVETEEPTSNDKRKSIDESDDADVEVRKKLKVGEADKSKDVKNESEKSRDSLKKRDDEKSTEDRRQEEEPKDSRKKGDDVKSTEDRSRDEDQRDSRKKGDDVKSTEDKSRDEEQRDSRKKGRAEGGHRKESIEGKKVSELNSDVDGKHTDNRERNEPRKEKKEDKDRKKETHEHRKDKETMDSKSKNEMSKDPSNIDKHQKDNGDPLSPASKTPEETGKLMMQKVDMLEEYKLERQRYKDLRQLHGRKGSKREADTLAMLDKFKNKLKSERDNDYDVKDVNVPSDEEESAQGDTGWLNHKLRFENNTKRVLDANITDVDRYEIIDPRNPLTKRRREASKNSSKSSGKKDKLL